jgi:lipopolysaccharide transport system permease protein
MILWHFVMAAPRRQTRELVLRPESALSWQDFVDAWDCRELLWILALRDVNVRYKQAALGVAWALLQPLTQMVIFTVLFNRFAGIPPDYAVPYPVFCFSGLTVWMLFSSGLSHASESLVVSANLVTKVYFPRVIIPLATIVTAVVDFALTLLLLAVLMVLYGVPIHASALLAIPTAGVAVLCATALGLWASAINLQYRDVRYALPFFIQLLVFLTPVFYGRATIPERYRPLLMLNPMAAVVDAFRAALFGGDFPVGRLLLAALSALLVGLAGFVWFRRMERTFADRV